MRRRRTAKFDYYAALSIKSDASLDEIKKAYRAMAVKYHPDKNPDDKLTVLKFKQCTEAYEVLSNPELRSQYDNHEHYLVKIPSSDASDPASTSSTIPDWLKNVGRSAGFTRYER